MKNLFEFLTKVSNFQAPFIIMNDGDRDSLTYCLTLWCSVHSGQALAHSL